LQPGVLLMAFNAQLSFSAIVIVLSENVIYKSPNFNTNVTERLSHTVAKVGQNYSEVEHSNSDKKNFDSIRFGNLINLPLVHK